MKATIHVNLVLKSQVTLSELHEESFRCISFAKQKSKLSW